MAYRAVGLILFLLALGYAHFITPRGDFIIYGKKVSHAELKQMVPQAVAFERRSTPCPHWEALGRGQGKRPLAYIILSTDVTKKAGYGGPLELLLAISSDGTINELEVRFHQETPSYVFSLFEKSNLNKLCGSRVEGLKSAFVSLDGRSGATLSAKALLHTLEDSVGAFTGQRQKPGEIVGKSTLVLSTFVLLAFLLALISFQKRNLRLRKFTFIVTLGLAFYGMFLSIEGLFPLLLKGELHILRNYPWALLLTFAFLFAIFRGRLFCGHLCPFGALQELLGRLSKSMGQPGVEILRFPRFIFLALLLLLASHSESLSAFNPDPIFLLFRGIKEISAIVLLLLIALSTFFICRLWCRCFCPLGAFLTIAGGLASSPIDLSGTNCSSCKACLRNCPVGAIRNVGNQKTVVTSDCILCGRCQSVCQQVNNE